MFNSKVLIVSKYLFRDILRELCPLKMLWFRLKLAYNAYFLVRWLYIYHLDFHRTCGTIMSMFLTKLNGKVNLTH